MLFRSRHSLLHFFLAAPLCAGTLAGCGGADLTATGPAGAAGLQAQSAGRDKKVRGAVYAMTNAVSANAVVVYQRASDGSLTLGATVPTGGGGSGSQLDPTDSLGSQGGLMLDKVHHLLFAVNTETAAANTTHDCNQGSISAFRIDKDGSLALAGKVPSGGLYPDSLAVSDKVLYVLNAGGPDTCSGSPGFEVNPNITGFSFAEDGTLSRVPGATRLINPGIAPEACAQAAFPSARFDCGLNPPAFPRSAGQVSFTPGGDHLIVTVKGTNSIYVFPVGGDNTPAAPVVTRAPGPTLPTYFGFGFDTLGRVVISEPFGTATAIPKVPAGAASSYAIQADGSLAALSTDVPSGEGTTCWVAMEPRHKDYAYTANNATSSLSVYQVNGDGTLVHVVGAEQRLQADGSLSAHPNDLAAVQEGDSAYLYSLNSGTGKVGMFSIQDDGTLAALGEIGGLPASGGAQGLAAY